MAETRVPATWFAQGYLPRICARHGGPASAASKRTFYTRTPPLLYLLLLASVLLFVIVALIVRKTIPGALPGCAQCASERSRYVLSVSGAWGACLALFIVAGFAASLALVVLGGVGVVFAAVWSCIGDRLRVRGSLSTDQAWVELRGANETFTDQIERALRGTPQAQIPAVVQAGYGNPTPMLATGAATQYGDPANAPGSPTVAPNQVAPSRDILPGR